MFDFATGNNTRADLQIGLFFPLACPANAPLLDCRSSLAKFTLYRYTAIQDFESCDHKDFNCQLNTCHVVPVWQISPKTSPLQVFLLDRLKRFTLKSTNLILKLQFQKLHSGYSDSSRFLHSLSSSLWTYFDKSSKVLTANDNMVKWIVFKIQGFACKRFLPSPPPLSSFWLSHRFSCWQNAENPVPLIFLAPQPHRNACYAG